LKSDGQTRLVIYLSQPSLIISLNLTGPHSSYSFSYHSGILPKVLQFLTNYGNGPAYTVGSVCVSACDIGILLLNV